MIKIKTLIVDKYMCAIAMIRFLSDPHLLSQISFIFLLFSTFF